MDGQLILDTLFGCCLGRGRRTERSHDGPSSSNDSLHADEQTPLLVGGRQKHQGDRSGGGYAGGQAGGPSGGGRQGQATTKDEEHTDVVGAGGKPRRKKHVNSARLKMIRDQAHAAFFNVESSQLLPSTSSLAQTQASIGSSQKLNRRDRSQDRTDEGMTYAALQRKELIAASDQAERLYKAAIKSNGQAHPGPITAAEEGSTTLPSSSSSPKSIEQTAPIGLVRQVRLSVRDTSEQDKPFKAQQVTGDPASSAGAVRASKVSPSRATFTIQPESLSSTSTSHESNLVNAGTKIHRLPSVHSLRTLRLGVLPANETENDDILFGRSVQSGTMSDATTNDLDRQTARSTDDERWERRGRTRSRRGLVWMDTTARIGEMGHVESGEPAERGGKLLDLWKDDEEKSDEIQYGLRFDVKDAEVKRREIAQRLEQSLRIPMAESWEEATNADEA